MTVPRPRYNFIRSTAVRVRLRDNAKAVRSMRSRCVAISFSVRSRAEIHTCESTVAQPFLNSA
jgi:hypothetical protein